MCMCVVAADGLLITDTVPVVVIFGWTTFGAVVLKQVSQTVHTTAGAATAVVITGKMSLSRATYLQTVCSSKHCYISLKVS